MNLAYRPHRPHMRVFLNSVDFLNLRSFKAPGCDVDYTRGYEYQPCDIAVVYGLENPPRTSPYARIRNAVYRQHTGPVVCIESSIVGRVFKARYPWLNFIRSSPLRPRQEHPYYRVSVGPALGDTGDFNSRGAPGNRWRAMRKSLGIKVRPYRKDGNHVLLIGQVPRDASMRGVDVCEWLVETAIAIRGKTDRPIRVRLHPSTRRRAADAIRTAFTALPDVVISETGTPLTDDLKGAWCCVTYSSGTAIDALIAGIPPICLSPASLAYSLCSTSLDEIEAPRMPEMRGQFLNELAYSQWSVEEMRSGEAWAHIRSAVERHLVEVFAI